MAKTHAGEKLYLEYPGKESQRSGRKKRPYDFFPVIEKRDGTRGRDSGFNDIFGILHDSLTTNQDDSHIRWLATLFYRMAFMLDHCLIGQPRLQARLLVSDEKGNIQVHEEGKLELGPFFRYEPNPSLLAELAKVIPALDDISLEGFARYCELLAWNEDSKYYYRDVEVGKGTWIGARGRVNTLLTVVRVLGYILGDVHFGNLLGRFSFGVSPASREEVTSITGGFVQD